MWTSNNENFYSAAHAGWKPIFFHWNYRCHVSSNTDWGRILESLAGSTHYPENNQTKNALQPNQSAKHNTAIKLISKEVTFTLDSCDQCGQCWCQITEEEWKRKKVDTAATLSFIYVPIFHSFLLSSVSVGHIDPRLSSPVWRPCLSLMLCVVLCRLVRL